MVSLHVHAREARTSTPIVDCHTHTSFSDGTSTFEQNVAAAARRDQRGRHAPPLTVGTHNQ